MKNNNAIRLIDLINLQEIQQLQDSFALSYNITSVIADSAGVEITKGSNYNKICQAIRATELGELRCRQSNYCLGQKSAKSMKPEVMYCTNCGFLEASAPIFVNDEHVASWHISHKTKGVDQQKLIECAYEIGILPHVLLDELDESEGLTKEQFQEIAQLLWMVANQISNQSYALYSAKQAIKEQQSMHQELQEQRKQLRKMASEYLLTEERVKRKIAMELHDTIGHSLVILKRNLNSYKPMFLDDTLLKRDCVAIEDIINQTRNLTFRLSSPILFDFGVSAAIEALADEVFRPNNIDFVLNDYCPNLNLREDDRVLLHRILSELCFNILKHAQAKKVVINLYFDENNLISEVIDDGIGFYYNQFYDKNDKLEISGFGLFGIKEHLKNYGGSLSVNSKVEKGTHIKIMLPIVEREETICL